MEPFFAVAVASVLAGGRGGEGEKGRRGSSYEGKEKCRERSGRIKSGGRRIRRSALVSSMFVLIVADRCPAAGSPAQATSPPPPLPSPPSRIDLLDGPRPRRGQKLAETRPRKILSLTKLELWEAAATSRFHFGCRTDQPGETFCSS